MQLGIDLFLKGIKKYKYKKLAILTNHSSTSKNLIPSFKIISEKLNIKFILAPEHGLFGTKQMEEKIEDEYFNNIPVISLYGEKGPFIPENIFDEFDILIIDIPDSGSRYYTYKWTMMMCIEKCSKYKKEVIILDRPNPLNGIDIEGPILDKNFKSFVGYYPIPVRFALTPAELAIYLNEKFKIGCEIKVYKMEGWKRKYYFDDLNLKWIPPSPNIPDFETCLLYAGMCLFEGTNISEGRGTTRPFKIFGADFIEPFKIEKHFKNLKEIILKPTYFKPLWSKYKGKICGGFEIYIKNRKKFKPFKTGVEIIKILKNVYPEKFEWKNPPYEFEKDKMPFDLLAGNSYIREMIEKNFDYKEIEEKWKKDLEEYKEEIKDFFLYN
ncbi:MAG: DUF1343 domain-containing protein [candidate division WOR-3 bacterium]